MLLNLGRGMARRKSSGRRTAKIGSGKKSPGRRAAKSVLHVRSAAALRRRLREALEHQAATSEVLQVISRSRGDLEPVYQSILANARRICEAKFGLLYQCESNRYRLVATHSTPQALANHQRSRG